MRHALVLLAAALLLLAGCGGDKKSSSGGSGSPSGEEQAASWTNDLCSAFVTWQGSLQSAAATFKSGQIGKFQGAAQDISNATKQLGSDLRSLGKPPSTGAASAKSAVTQLSQNLQANVDKIQKALEGLSKGQGISNAVSTTGAAVSSMGDAFSSATKELQSLKADDPWRKAFASSEACQKLAGR